MSTQSSSAVQRPAHRSAQEISTRIDLQFSLKYENHFKSFYLLDYSKLRRYISARHVGSGH